MAGLSGVKTLAAVDYNVNIQMHSPMMPFVKSTLSMNVVYRRIRDKYNSSVKV
jgi:hypothetical protein